MHESPADPSRQGQRAGLGTPGRVALGVFASAAAYILWTEHCAYTIEYLPWLILTICPLMHFFMHRGHGSHKGAEGGTHSP